MSGPFKLSGAGGLLHFVLEAAAYVFAAAVYVRERRRFGDVLGDPDRISLLVAAAVGAAIGSRMLFGLCEPAETARHATDLSYLLGGKTIVGALLGGLIAVEATKRAMGISTPTGDLYVRPLCAGIGIGRLGCFFAGPADHTAGLPTALPWGIAMGDSVRRHPTALYEILFVLLLAIVLGRILRSHRGLAFALFLASYLAFRLGIDFLKPEPPPLAFVDGDPARLSGRPRLLCRPASRFICSSTRSSRGPSRSSEERTSGRSGSALSSG